MSHEDTGPALLETVVVATVVPSTTGQRNSQFWSSRVKCGIVKPSIKLSLDSSRM